LPLNDLPDENSGTAGRIGEVRLTPPGQSNRTDKGRLLAVLGISESEYVARFTSPTQTDWVMRCTPRKVLRAAEQEPFLQQIVKKYEGTRLGRPAL
jgi:hypothetical protein